MSKKVLIKEIFESIQGEGVYIGVNQLFIRFSRCNLHCSYCDTDFKSNLTEYTTDSLLEKVNHYKNIHSISLTGGEPLSETDFLQDFLPLCRHLIYLETNGTLFEQLEKIIDYIDIISMDIKLFSSSQMPNLFEKHTQFVKTALKYNKELFLKIVFNEKITDFEIINTINLAKKYNLLIILQPQMDGDILNLPSNVINNVFYRFIRLYPNVRLIPQVHKFINVQ
ncbi:MAG: 7-carboxy-7-deazaguanine synthase QueE [Candidatus Gastranaerophilales bacterium]|nr:7-carboxy-7-deazaguanine synthase QueE [Candidatus Gastranaerophilales bacterium]